MAIQLLTGLHITATQKRHVAAIIANGWQTGRAGQLSYAVTPIEGQAGAYAVTISKKERDDWGRPVERVHRVTVKVH